jgi:DNA-3-methyladenine glycosylase
MEPAAPATLSSNGGPPRGTVLGSDFFARETVDVARDVLGKLLVREVDGRTLWGRLVEVEAYLAPADLASHAARGRRTPRNEVMYSGPGHAYVYFTYGMYFCLNFVTREAGMPQAVLVRALEPGPEVGRCSGPGLVCRALKIDRTVNGLPLRPPDIYVVDDQAPRRRIFSTPRIGIAGTGRRWERRLLRFCVDSLDLSRPLSKKTKRGA